MKILFTILMVISSSPAFADSMVIIDCYEKATIENNTLTLGGSHIRFAQPKFSARSEAEDGWKVIDSDRYQSNLGKCELNFHALESYPVIYNLDGLNCPEVFSGEYNISKKLKYSAGTEKWEFVTTGKINDEYHQEPSDPDTGNKEDWTEKQSFETCQPSFINY